VGGDPDDLVVGEGRESDGTGGVGDLKERRQVNNGSRQRKVKGEGTHEVEEGSSKGDDGTVSVKTVHDGSHGVLPDTVSDVSTRVVAEAGLRSLEVDGLLPSGEVGSSQVGRSTDELRKRGSERLEDDLGVLSGSDGSISHLVDGEVLLPTLGKVAGDSSGELGSLGGVLGLVRGKESVPLLVGLGSLVGGLLVELVDVLGDVEERLGVHAELLLDSDDVVLLEGWNETGEKDAKISSWLAIAIDGRGKTRTSTVDTVGSLELGPETDGSGELDKGGLVGRLLSLLDGGEHAGEVTERDESIRWGSVHSSSGGGLVRERRKRRTSLRSRRGCTPNRTPRIASGRPR
jgi:hypothetical protein